MNSQQQLSTATADGMSSFSLQPSVGQPLGGGSNGHSFGTTLPGGNTKDQTQTNGMMGLTGTNNGSKAPGSAMGGTAGGGNSFTSSTHQDFLSAQARERGRMLQVLQQQQQQQQRQLSMARGLPVLQSIAGHDTRTPGAGTSTQRFMVDDFAGAGALLSRPEQEFLLARSGYPNITAAGLSSFSNSTDAMDLSHPGKLADFLLAKQAVALNGALMLPKVTRLPCQARGMKADHNSTTAFFEIADDARHGQHLLCSHPACRSAGVKFRYCLYCKKPVTKQNFRSRHLHADLDPNHNGKMGKLVRKRSNEKHNDEDDDGSASEEPATKQAKMEQGPSSPTQSRHKLWESLLTNRPEGLDTMNVWIGSVLSASDPQNPLPVDDEDRAAGSSESSRKDRWNALLKQRMTSGVNDVDATKWLTEVLRVSAEPENEKQEKNDEKSKELEPEKESGEDIDEGSVKDDEDDE
ncbi:hypothetical protein IV203_005135 [Nitzschia inconspicua]|uniref:Uncharacterized protein n=1 Tax=Nitzschia inconspicua TaxID=303405 RepID=A0A9K3KLQ9_9STRA|nr:hypothetical protein IV203_005135 [Nitzschia inconspicua]